MRCPSCGALCKKRSMKCPECGAFRNKTWVNSDPELLPGDAGRETTSKQRKKTSVSAPPATSLIEFPGLNKSPIPQWRKELGERVREAQQKRSREATLEETGSEIELLDEKTRPLSLELLPQAEVPPMNPLVVAALQRIERANGHANAAVATLPAYDEQPDIELKRSGLGVANEESDLVPAEESQPAVPREERVHNLAVVPSPTDRKVDTPPRSALKPKRLIVGDVNDPALNYLDSIPTTVGVDVRVNRAAPLFLRLLGGVVDLIMMALLTLPFVGLTRVMELDWQDVRVITFVSSTFALMGFLYLTMSTALTGRTCGKGLLSLRVVDSRTGLIPTGAQAAGRALVYMLSLASAGLVFFFTFLDRERQTPHDRFARTAVVRV